MISTLRQKLKTKKARLSVIGLGYVGLPVACKFAEAGFDVTGVDIKADRIKMINRGDSPIEGKEPGLTELLNRVVSNGKLHATTDYNDLRTVDVILIAVETPVDETNTPRYESLRAALQNLGPVLKRGALVIIESTIAPGTIQNLVVPTLQETSGLKVSQELFVGNCPERVMPGRLLANLADMSRVVGGMSPETAKAMVILYRHVVQADLDPVDCITAELVKTAENAYRDVQIAFANELAIICETNGANVWQVRQLVNKSPGRNVHLPGPGVGGHCIPKDPWLLAYGALGKVPVRLIPAARTVNNYMPHHMLNLTTKALQQANIDINKARVAVLGYAYLENSDDTRDTPTAPFVSALQKAGAEVIVHDPYVNEYRLPLEQAVKDADCVALLVRHDQYIELDLQWLKNYLRHPILVDGRNVFDRSVAKIKGFSYYGIGTGVT